MVRARAGRAVSRLPRSGRPARAPRPGGEAGVRVAPGRGRLGRGAARAPRRARRGRRGRAAPAGARGARLAPGPGRAGARRARRDVRLSGRHGHEEERRAGRAAGRETPAARGARRARAFVSSGHGPPRRPRVPAGVPDPSDSSDRSDTDAAWRERVRAALADLDTAALASRFPAPLVTALVADASEPGRGLELALAETIAALDRVGVPRGRQFVLLGGDPVAADAA